MAGWISLHRSIQEHWIWQEKPFDKRSAWIDLLLSANHKDNKFLLGNNLVDIERGSFITSEVKLSDRWGWSRTKVRNFLELLEKDNMLLKESDNKKTVLTIVNYNDYQVQETSKEHQENINKTSKEHQENTNNNVNNVNNDNKSLFMYDEKIKNIVNLLENNIGTIPPILIDDIAEYSKTFDSDMFSEAIKIAANKKVRTVNYVLGILKQWKDNNILTIDDLEAFRNEQKIKSEDKKEKQQTKKTKYNQPAKKTRFHNFDQRTSNYSEDQLESIARKKREEYFKKAEQREKAL